MKKIKSKPVKISRSPFKLKIFNGLAVVALVATAGVATIIFSRAAATGGITIVITDTVKNIPVGDIGVSLERYNEEATLCNGTLVARAGTNGQAIFTGCAVYPSAVYVISSTNLASRGYKINANSPKNIGGQVTTAPGVQGMWYVNVSPIDTDSDGFPNNTSGYPVDNCPNVAGSNGGCPPTPAPAPTPTTTPPPSNNTPAPSNTTSKPNTTKPSTNSSTKKPSTNSKATAPAVVVATQGDTTPPSSPENLTISQSEDGLFLSWDDATDNVGVTGYNIERSDDAENWVSLTTNLSDSFYTDTDLGNSDFYYYRIQATDAAGNLSEGALGNIELASSSNGESKTKPASPAAKKSNAGLVAGLTIGVIFVLLAIVGAFLLMRRRMLNSTDPYAYDVSNMTNGGMVPSATVMPGSSTQHQAMNEPQYDTGPPAQHTSVSLKEMVMEEMNRHGQNQPPQPPHPPTPQ